MSGETTQTISNSTLGELPEAFATPTFDRQAVSQGIVHIGVGGFHRAHLATYANELCESGHKDWAILGAGILEHDQRMSEALLAQDGLYTLISRGPDATDLTLIGSITGYVYAFPDASELVEAIAADTTHIVSLTITEGGYPINDVTGAYDPESNVAGPGSAFAILAAGLEQRMNNGGPAITVLSCDNIMSNGHAAQTSTHGEANRAAVDGLTDWIAANVSFPNSMVDRITPSTSPTDIVWLEETHNVTDRWPVVAEPFRQWVLEDNFAGKRPPLEELDVIVTDDVEPFELMKLRLLNAGHSCLAYLAALEGIDTVDKAMANQSIQNYVGSFLRNESKPVLPPVELDLDEYIDSLVERFSNPSVGDQVQRLCLDGSAKFPKFLLPTVRAQVAAGGSVAHSALALAGWCHYLNGVDCHGNPVETANDPNLDAAKSFAERSKADPAAFLDFDVVFDTDLASNESFRAAFVSSLETLRSDGVRAAIDTVLP